MGFCTSPPALVFEFMELGSLYSNLHKKVAVSLSLFNRWEFILLLMQDKKRMNWQQRCKVLKDACRGLAWLHGADPPLIHQDIKS